MKNWNTPVINGIHALCIAANVLAGVFDIHRHSHFWPFSFIVAGFIVGLNIQMGRTRRRLRALRELLARETNDGFDLAFRMRNADKTEKELMDVRQMAMNNLVQVASAVGARVGEGGDCAEIVIGKYHYRITPGYIYRSKSIGQFQGFRLETPESTCLQVRGCIPYPEMIAAALLLLKNDPTIFDRWKRHDAYYS